MRSATSLEARRNRVTTWRIKSSDSASTNRYGDHEVSRDGYVNAPIPRPGAFRRCRPNNFETFWPTSANGACWCRSKSFRGGPSWTVALVGWRPSVWASAGCPLFSAPVHDTLPVVYMLRAASKRRHLSDDQRACLAQEEMEYLAAQNRELRARSGGRLADEAASGPMTPRSTRSASNPFATVAGNHGTVVAKSYGISHRKVHCARQLKRDAPRLYRKVKSGELRLAEAKREAERAAKRGTNDNLPARLATTKSGRPPLANCRRRLY